MWTKLKAWFLKIKPEILYFLQSLFAKTFADIENLAKEDLQKITSIVIDAVKKAEINGGKWHEKRDFAVSIITPQIKVMGVSLLTTSLDWIISGVVARLGYSNKAI